MKMRRVKWEEYKSRRLAFVKPTIQDERGRRRRTREPAKEAVLSRLTEAAWGRRLESGQLEKIGPRRWRVHINKTLALS